MNYIAGYYVKGMEDQPEWATIQCPVKPQKVTRFCQCICCGEFKEFVARNLCNACYNRAKRAKILDTFPLAESSKAYLVEGEAILPAKKKRGKPGKCSSCGSIRQIVSKGMCNRCYKHSRRGQNNG